MTTDLNAFLLGEEQAAAVGVPVEKGASSPFSSSAPS